MQRFLLLLTTLLLTAAILPGKPIDYELAKESRMWIEGTSTIHNWTCEVGSVSGVLSMDFGTLAISKATVMVPSPSIDCENGTMNKKVAQALSIKDYPAINFSLTNGTVTKTGDDLIVHVSGLLELAGQSKEVSTTATATPLSNGLYKIAGSLPIAMSDFDIDPPTAMLGTLKTGNNVTVHFELSARPTVSGAVTNAR